MMSMGGGGSIQNMQNALKNNKKLLAKRASLFKRKSVYSSTKNRIKKEIGELNYHELTEEERSKLRAKLKASNKKYALSLTAYSLIAGILIFSLLFVFLNPFQKEFVSDEKVQQNELKASNYNFYIEDGDAWFAKRKWQNAIFQYKNASRSEPNAIEAKIKLSYSYLNNCKFENEGCYEAVMLIKELKEEYPDQAQILILENEMKDMYIYKNEKDI